MSKPIDAARQGDRIAEQIRAGEITVPGVRNGAELSEIVAFTIEELAYRLREALKKLERLKEKARV